MSTLPNDPGTGHTGKSPLGRQCIGWWDSKELTIVL
jgi:hypothetical protein